jgi:arsenate reductase
MTTRQITVWHYAGCSTCKKALSWLKGQQVAFVAIDLVADVAPTAAQLATIRDAAGLATAKLFNTSGQVYREEGWAERSRTMTDPEILTALSSRGKLIKRPLLLVQDGDQTRAAVGFDPDKWLRTVQG